MSTNGKSYTEVVAEFDKKLTDVRIEFIERVNESDTTVMEKLGLIHTDLGRGDEKFNAQEKRIATNEADIKANEGNITKVRNLNTGIALLTSTIAGILGVNK